MNIEELKKEIFAKILEIAELEDDEEAVNFPYDAPLFDGRDDPNKPCLNLDSLVTLELVVDIMENYNVKIEDDDVRKLNTVNSIAEYVMKRIEE